LDVGLEKGLEAGMEKGLEAGMEKGLGEGIRNTLLNQTAARFGVIPVGLTAKLNTIKDIGTLQNESSDAMRITWEGAWCLGSSGAAAKYENFWQSF
jgi:predicted transposase YdaD